MNFLYPVILAGLAAVGLPILLHLARRDTRKRVTFSSLMFLRTTLPRFKHRSRPEHLLLLALRCTAVCLLAFAFARPFFVRPQPEEPAAAAGKRLVVLVDTSASMRRAGAWAQAVREARAALGEAGPTDRVCVMSFDQGVQTQIGFEQWAALEPQQRQAVAMEQVGALSPGWGGTNLGGALVTAAEAMEEDEVNDAGQVRRMRQVVLISDLQQGSRLEALQGYEWPEGVELVVRAVRPIRGTNAAMQLAAGPGQWPGRDQGPGGEFERGQVAVRVSNSGEATTERFQLHWADETSGGASGQAIDVYVPAGQSVVVRIPMDANKPAARRLILTGDDQDFDNTLYLAPRPARRINILYVGGEEPNDPKQMLYYLRRAFGDTGVLKSQVVRRAGSESLAAEAEAADLVIVGDSVSRANVAALRRYVESGGTLFLVMKSAEAAATLGEVAGTQVPASQEAQVDRYAMLGRLEYTHPLLAAFAEPRFGDFTRIHFWRYRRINISDYPEATVLAWFDSNDPALVEMFVGKGAVLALACGWQPADSDLALSSKFVPLLYSILEYGGRGGTASGSEAALGGLAGRWSQYCVGDAVPVPQGSAAGSVVQIRKPDNGVVRLEAGQRTFGQTDVPGIYAVEGDGGGRARTEPGQRIFAVNVAAQECRTDPMSIDDLEGLGVSLKQGAGAAMTASEQKTKRRASFAELEHEQKVWRWVLAAVAAVLLAETWLGGRLTRPARGPAEEDEFAQADKSAGETL